MNIVKKCIIFGAQGLLGKECFLAFSEQKDLEVIPLSHFNYNLLVPEEIEKAFRSSKPNVVINCSGFTDVDSAELPENEDLVYRVNSDAPQIMARLCAKSGAKLIHFSTDYVFNGKNGGYDEQSPVDPINVYGDSKLEGEMGIWEEDPTALVIRTSRLFGDSRENFVTRIIAQAKKNKPIPAISDEIGHFTFTVDLAQAVLKLLQENPDACGVFHMFGKDVVSPLEVAEEVVRLLKSNSSVQKIKGSEARRFAKRPKNCTLKTFRAPELSGIYNALPRFLGSYQA